MVLSSSGNKEDLIVTCMWVGLKDKCWLETNDRSQQQEMVFESQQLNLKEILKVFLASTKTQRNVCGAWKGDALQ